jgi:hypothetical protein
MRLDIGEMVKGIQQRFAAVTGIDWTAGEVVELLRDTHRILGKLEALVDRADVEARKWEEKLAGFEVSPERLARLERAVFNIERATLGVEASMGALPRVLRSRIARERKPGAGDSFPDLASPGESPNQYP